MRWRLPLKKTKPNKRNPKGPLKYCYVLIPLKSENPLSVSGKIRIIHISFIALFSSLLLSILWILVQWFSQSPFFFLWDLAIICEIVFALHGKVLVVGWTSGLTSVRTFQKLSSCPRKPVPTGSRWTFPSWVFFCPSTVTGELFLPVFQPFVIFSLLVQLSKGSDSSCNGFLTLSQSTHHRDSVSSPAIFVLNSSQL